MKNKPSKMSQEIKEIIYQIKAVEIEGSPTIMDYQTAIDQLLTLCSTAVDDIIGEDEDARETHTKLCCGTLTNREIFKEERNKLKENQRQRKTRWFDEN